MSQHQTQDNDMDNSLVTHVSSDQQGGEDSEEEQSIGQPTNEPEEAASLTDSNCMLSRQTDYSFSAAQIADQDSGPDDAMDVNDADFLRSAQELIFEKGSDQHHQAQGNSEQESEKRNPKAKRYHKRDASMNVHESGVDMGTQDERNQGTEAGIKPTTGDVLKQVPAQVESNCTAIESGVTLERVHFISIRFSDRTLIFPPPRLSCSGTGMLRFPSPFA